MNKHGAFFTKCLLVASVTVSFFAADARAWDAPDGPTNDTVTPPAPGALLTKAHGYITQNGISILYNDGYWFAAQTLRASQLDILGGVRYADVYQGRQSLGFEECIPFTNECTSIPGVPTFTDWGYAADNHYYNPDTGIGLNPTGLTDINTYASWLQVLGIGLGVPGLRVAVSPQFSPPYTSALNMMQTEYVNAMVAFLGGTPPPSIGSRTGKSLAMFYLGWASHFMQDLTVVHHTFDEVIENHQAYEASADGLVTSPPALGDWTMKGIYFGDLPVIDCGGFERTAMCFAARNAQVAHDQTVMNQAANGNYSNVVNAIPLAERSQAGLFAKFLTDVGQKPVHMSAAMAAVSLVTL